MNIDASCPYAEDVSFTLSHEGLANQFNSEATLKNGNEVSTITIAFQQLNGVTGKVEVVSPFTNQPIVIEISHEGNLMNFNTRASVNDIRADATWSRSRDAMSAKAGLESPYFERINGEFNFNGNEANFQTKGAVSYSRSEKIEFNIEYKSVNGIPNNVQATFTSPFSGFEILSVDMRNTPSRGKFNTQGTLSWAPRQAINFQSVGRYSGTITDLSVSTTLSLSTPFTAVRAVALTVTHAHTAASLNTKVDLDLNREKVFDADIQLSPSSGNMDIRQPHPASASYEIRGESANIAVNWNTATRDSNFRVEVINRDTSTYSRTTRAVSIRTISPSRTMALSADIDHSSKTFSQKASFAWDASQDKEISYSIEANDKSRRGQSICDASFVIKTPVRSMEFLGSHNDDSRTFTSSATWKWDAARDQSKKMTVTNTYQRVGETTH